MLVIFHANRWKDGVPLLSTTNSFLNRLREAASKLVAYKNSYCSKFNAASIFSWEREINTQITGGSSSNTISAINRMETVSHTDHGEKIHPGYLHHLYREVTLWGRYCVWLTVSLLRVSILIVMRIDILRNWRWPVDFMHTSENYSLLDSFYAHDSISSNRLES